MNKLTGDAARQAFKDKGLSYSDLDMSDIEILRDMVLKSLTSDEYKSLFRGTYRINKRIIGKKVDSKDRLKEAYIECRADYFKKREAISFNSDGFIGFAGWSSSGNLAPIIKGFYAWLDTIKGES